MGNRNRVVSSVRWAIVESGLNAVTGLLSTLTIGHFIQPQELGRAGAAMAVIGLVEIAASFGIGEALVRSRSFHTTLTDSAYTGLILISLLGAAVCMALAWPIAALYHDSSVGVLIGVGSLLLPLGSIDAVPIAILTRKMRIDVLAKRGILSKMAVVVVGSTMAYAGIGAWSILGGALAGSGLATVCLFGSIGRWPRLRLRWPEFRGLMAFGGPISLEILLWTVTSRVFGLLFGAFHGLEALGYLQFAQRLIDELALLIQNFTLRFGLSYFARVERTGGDISAAFLLGTKIITFVGAPVLLGFAAVSPDVLTAIIGARWLPSLPYLAVAALSWSTVVPTILVSPALRARGHQAALVIISAISCTLALLACVLTQRAGVGLSAVALGARHFIILPTALWMAHRYLRISVGHYLAAFTFPIGWALAMAAVVWQFQHSATEFTPLMRLLVGILGGALFYMLPMLTLERTIMHSVKPFVTGSS